MHNGLPYIDLPDGTRRFLGHIPQTDPLKLAEVPNYRDTASLIPESKWEEFHEWPDEIAIKDQNGKGACNGHAAASAIEVARYVAGMPHISLSAWYVYAILCNGIDRGSGILDALRLCQDDGVSPEEFVKYGVINPRSLTAEAHAAAPRFKIEIGSKLTTYEEIGTAVQRRESLNVAVCVGGGFNNLDSDGVAPLGRGATNHAVCMALQMKKSRSGLWLGGIANSWTPAWGNKGFFFEPIKQIVNGGYFEAYTVRAVVDDTGDITKPPQILIA